MTDNAPVVKVAVVQAAPVLFDRNATIEKTCRLTAEAASRGARLIVFPEAFIPAYPRGLSFGTVVGNRSHNGRRTWHTYWSNAVDVPGPATRALGEAAREANAYLAVGVIERDSCFSRGTLYCTLSGTSMATPYTSAAAALEIARLKRKFNQASIVSRLQSTATDLGAAGRDNSYGFGLINPSRLLTGK